MASPIRVCCEAEGNGERKNMGMRKVGKYLAIQIWSSNTAKTISSNFLILNGGLSPGRYWMYLPLWNTPQIYYILFKNK